MWDVHTGAWVATGNSVGEGAYLTAGSMNNRQMVAGNVGPETAMPCTDSIGISPRG